MHQNCVKYTKIFLKRHKNKLGKFIASKKKHFWNKTRLFLSPFLVTNGLFLILAKTFRKDYVATSSTARRNATEKNELSGYVTVPCSSKLTQHKSTADWLIF